MKRILLLYFLFLFTFAFSSQFLNNVTRGIAYLKAGDYDNAISYFNRSKQISPENPIVYYYLGEAYFRKGDVEKSIKYYNEAIQRDPHNPDFIFSLGFAYLAKNNTKKALEEFEKVIKLAPQSLAGKRAKTLKENLEKNMKEKNLASKWAKLEEEEKKRLEEEKKQQQQSKQTGPGQFAPGVPGPEGMVEITGEKKVPVEKLIKRIRYGTKSIKEDASRKLTMYPASEILKVYKEIIEIAQKEKDIEVKKNLIISLGKIDKPEVGEFLLSVIQDENSPFEIKIAALESIGGVKTKSVIDVLRDTLDKMVQKREKERAEARKNIQQIETQIDKLQVEKITLNSEINKLQQERNNISSKLQMGPMMGPEFFPPEGAPQFEPVPAVPSGGGEVLTKEEIEKLHARLKEIDGEVKKKQDRVKEIEDEIRKLQGKLQRYQMLLARKSSKTRVSSLTEYSTQYPPGVEPMPGMEPGMMPPQFTPSSQQRSEEENEIIFAMKIMISLGKMKDTDSLPVIKKAWQEFGVENYRIYYALTLARLGDYSMVDLLLARLKEDYPQGENVQNEVNLRADIITVLGDYLKTNPDEEIIGLLSYLSDEGQYPEIKKSASDVLASLPKGK